jgi:hypothetical protein
VKGARKQPKDENSGDEESKDDSTTKQ